MSDADLNIKYKNVFLNSFDNKSSYENTKIDNINSFLEKESTIARMFCLNEEIKLLNNYADSLVETNNLSPAEVNDLKQYLTDSLDKKKLQHVKDVVCDKITGKIVSIPTLHFNSITKKYTLKRSEKRVSTLKSLGKGKKTAEHSMPPPSLP